MRTVEEVLRILAAEDEARLPDPEQCRLHDPGELIESQYRAAVDDGFFPLAVASLDDEVLVLAASLESSRQ